MKNSALSAILIAATLFIGCANKNTASNANSQDKNVDPYLWLEEVESPKALGWVKDQNVRMEGRLKNTDFYKQTEKEVRKIMLAKDRLPHVQIRKDVVYNFWQDQSHERGLWRRASLSEYAKTNPKWEILLDVDKLSKEEKEEWVWKGSSCLENNPDMCIVSLSRGGKDAVVLREYNLKNKKFVKDGFNLPEAKGSAEWVDENTVLVGSDFGAGTMTSSGYPRQVRRWTRGQNISAAKIMLEIPVEDMGAWVSVGVNKTGKWITFTRQKTFYTAQHFMLGKNDQLIPLPLPEDADVKNLFQDQLLFTLRSPWKTPQGDFLPGQLLSLSLQNLQSPVRVVYNPPDRAFLQWASVSANAVFVHVLENVQGQIYRLDPSAQGTWTASKVEGASPGNMELEATDSDSNIVLAQHESFLSPPSIWMLDSAKPTAKFEKVKSLPARFDAKNLQMEQFEVTSRDGVKVPYFVVRPKNMKFDGSNPTLLYGYGGFEVALTPFYLGQTGKVWLEKLNGVYVLANIRGGGEFGPQWHAAALLENRQKAYDDFIAIAEDLIAKKITSPKNLGIMGGSNGGLLVGAIMTQRPDLFKSVVCQVPLLDMLRYHKLLAGNSWVAEYGNPDDPKMRDVILKYSPYQNLHAEKTYPEVFFMTSTKDDRVHPGHARKMAAKMAELQKNFVYYENTEGGHGGAATLEQKIKFSTLTLSFLKDTLVTAPATKKQ